MKLKKLLRFLTLLCFLLIASIVPFPISFHRKDNLPIYKIEQLDKMEDEDDEEEECKLFS